MALTELPAQCLAHSGRSIKASCHKPRPLARSLFLQEPFYFAAKGIRKVAGSPMSLAEEEESKRWSLEKKQEGVPESAPVGTLWQRQSPHKEAQGRRAQPLVQVSEGRRLLLGPISAFP